MKPAACVCDDSVIQPIRKVAGLDITNIFCSTANQGRIQSTNE